MQIIYDPSADPPVGGFLLDGTLAAAQVGNLLITDAMVAAANKDGTAATPSMRTLSNTATTACAGNDTRLADTRAPTAASVVDASIVAGGLSYSKTKSRRICTATATASVTISSYAAATPTNILALPATAYDGNLVRIEFFAPFFAIIPATAANLLKVQIWDNDAPGVLAIISAVSGVVVAKEQDAPCFGFLELTPGAGTHTYSVRGFKSASADTAVIGAAVASGYAPMQITATYV
jgi:hypothetical protein